MYIPLLRLLASGTFRPPLMSSYNYSLAKLHIFYMYEQTRKISWMNPFNSESLYWAFTSSSLFYYIWSGKQKFQTAASRGISQWIEIKDYSLKIIIIIVIITLIIIDFFSSAHTNNFVLVWGLLGWILAGVVITRAWNKVHWRLLVHFNAY